MGFLLVVLALVLTALLALVRMRLLVPVLSPSSFFLGTGTTPAGAPAPLTFPFPFPLPSAVPSRPCAPPLSAPLLFMLALVLALELALVLFVGEIVLELVTESVWLLRFRFRDPSASGVTTKSLGTNSRESMSVREFARF